MNGRRQGRILEKPFGLGDTIRREEEPSGEAVPLLDIDSEIELAFSHRKRFSGVSQVQEMKALGLDRYVNLPSLFSIFHQLFKVPSINYQKTVNRLIGGTLTNYLMTIDRWHIQYLFDIFFELISCSLDDCLVHLNFESFILTCHN